MRLINLNFSHEEKKTLAILQPFRGVITVEERLMEIYLEEIQAMVPDLNYSHENVKKLVQKLKDGGWLEELKHPLRDTQIVKLHPRFFVLLKALFQGEDQTNWQKAFVNYYYLLAWKLKSDQESQEAETIAIAHDFIHIEKYNLLHAMNLAIRHKKDAFTLLFGLMIKFYVGMGQYPNAWKLCQKVLANHESGKFGKLANNRNELGLIYFRLNGIYRELGAFQKSQEALEMARKIAANDQNSKAEIAIALENAKREMKQFNFSLAATHLYRVSQIKPNKDNADLLAEAHTLLGTIFEREGDREKAEAHFLESGRLHKEFDLNLTVYLNELGSFYFNGRDYEQAEEVFLQSIDILEGNKSYTHHLGLSYVNLAASQAARKKTNEAQKNYHKAISLLKDQPDVLGHVYHNLSNLSMEMREYEEAESYALRAKEYYRDPRLKADISYNLGVMLKEMDSPRIDEAIECLIEAADTYKAVGQTQSLDAVYDEICYSFALTKKWEKAIFYEKLALQYATSDMNALVRSMQIAQLHTLNKDLSKAESWFEKSKSFVLSKWPNEELVKKYKEMLGEWSKKFERPIPPHLLDLP